MSRGIRLHPEHGVNPTMTQCYLCGGEKNEIALLGAAYRGKAPTRVCIDKEPCDSCKGMMAQGILLIGVRDGSQADPYRTGQIWVIKEEAAQKIFGDHDIVTKRAGFLEESAARAIGLMDTPNQGENA